jgi:hypothetical protein
MVAVVPIIATIRGLFVSFLYPSATVVVVVVVVSFTRTSPLGGCAGYHNYDYPYITI